jgi:hypothetical protein
MKVLSVRFTNPGHDEVEVSSDLGDFYLRWPCHTWHRQAILGWLDAGNKICGCRLESSPDLLREGLLRDVYKQAARLLEEAVGDYAVAEQIIWPDLEREARRFLLDGALGTLMKSILDEAGGRTEEELAYAIIHRANRLNRFRGAVIGARTRHVSHIKTAAADELESYRVGEGWPPLPPNCDAGV